MIYASCIAMEQDNLKRLVAYSSIAHIGLMCAAIFAMNEMSVQGVMMQMFNHGINIIGLWIVIDMIGKTNRCKTNFAAWSALPTKHRTYHHVGDHCLANIALPLPMHLSGEFLMFSGLYTVQCLVCSSCRYRVLYLAACIH